MDCVEVASALVAYQFATASDEEREGVEAHLVACRTCLETYLALKRAADAGTSTDRPSDAARARLREEVRRTFAPAPSSSSGAALWSRRIPLYQGVFAAAAAAAVAFAIPRLATRVEVRDPGTATPIVDSSRASAASLAIY